MKEIKAYKSDSGFISENKTEVEDNEKEFLFKKAVTELVESVCWRGMDKDDVVNFVIENKKELKKIL